MTTTNTIEFNKRAYKVGSFFETTRRFEELTGKSISDDLSTWDELIFFYCSLKASNKVFDYTFEQFREIMDQNPTLLAQFKGINTQRSGAKPVETVPNLKKKRTAKENFGMSMLFLLLLALPVWIPIISIIGLLWTSLTALFQCIVKPGKKRV